MGQISSKLRSGRAEDGERVTFFCPGCTEAHSISVRPDGAHDAGHWGFNRNFEAPTFTPSILVTGKQRHLEPDGQWKGGWIRDKATGAVLDKICHSFVTDGRIQFLPDSTHALAGQTVPIPDLPAWMRDAPFHDL
jgi:Family of unknown function (DUF6527)